MKPIRVLLVDDHALIRDGLRSALAQESGFTVVGEAADGFMAVKMVKALSPDVVLMDITMPRMNGLQATREICGPDAAVRTKVIILTLYDQDEHVFEALRAGASGFLLKDCLPAQLAEAIRAATSGDSMLSPSVTRRLISEFIRRPVLASVAESGLMTLTPRELDVFRLLVRGLSNEEIASTLMLGESTIKSHVKHVYQKLCVRDRAQVVIYAYENGLV
ncbi:response regulator [Amycolatopsis thailandensis]|uniref:response regulator n=1 Tax=Amycolatopsis thailandensis TaxID=589330 RepID=UPI003652D0C8